MKRIIVLFLLLVLVFSLSAELTGVNTLDGFDWVKWSRLEKVQFILGYWNALICMESIREEKFERNVSVAESGFTPLYEDLFEIKGNVGDWVYEIDRFYEDYNQREFPLWFLAIDRVSSNRFNKWAEE